MWKSRVRPLSATWICVCGHNCDVVIYSPILLKSIQWFGVMVAPNLAIDVTLTVGFYSRL